VLGRVLLLLNLFLAAALAFVVYGMYTTLSLEKTIKRKPAGYVFQQVERSSPAVSPGLGRIFDTDATGKAATSDLRESRGPDGGLNELVSGDEIIRVQGIFLTDKARFAIVSIIGRKKGKGKDEEPVKVMSGEKIRDFVVTRITPGSVHLAGPSSKAVILRIFKEEWS